MKLLQVGLGGWGQDWYTNVLATRDDVQVVGVVDPMIDSIDASKFPGAARFSTVQDALSTIQFDAVLVTVGIRWHADVARQLLEAGHHVLLEKPFCTSLDEAIELVQLAERNNCQLTIAHNYRYFAAARVAKELVASSELGKVLRSRVVFRKRGRSVRDEGYPEDRSLLVQLSVHHFDLMRSVLGINAARISAMTDAPGEVDVTSPTSVLAAIEMEDGSIVSYDATNRSANGDTPWSGLWTVELEHGSIIWSSGDLGESGRASVIVTSPDQPDRTVDISEVIESDRFAVLSSFIASVTSGSAAETSGRNNLGTIAMLDAALRSAISGQMSTVRKA